MAQPEFKSRAAVESRATPLTHDMAQVLGMPEFLVRSQQARQGTREGDAAWGMLVRDYEEAVIFNAMLRRTDQADLADPPSLMEKAAPFVLGGIGVGLFLLLLVQMFHLHGRF